MSRIEIEKLIVRKMIILYCRKQEGNKELCPQCKALLAYAHKRLSFCPFGDRKTTCQQCAVHCYMPEMRERMRQVMQFAGPKMLLYHPLITIRYWWKKSIMG